MGSVQDFGEIISNRNMSEPVVRHQPPKKPNTILSSGNGLNLHLGQSFIKRSSQDKQAVKKMRFTKNHSGAVVSPTPATSQASAASTPSPQSPIFYPMVPTAFPHKAYNTLPAIFQGLDAIEPIEILRLFFTNSYLKTMTDNTNKYASQKIAQEKRSGRRQWRR